MVALDYVSSNIASLKGKDLWVCCYSRPDFTKKAERNVKPTHVVVVEDKYTWSYRYNFKLQVISKSGNLTSRFITPSAKYSCVEVELHETELEAKVAYSNMLKKSKLELERYITNLTIGLNKQIDEIQKEIDNVI